MGLAHPLEGLPKKVSRLQSKQAFQLQTCLPTSRAEFVEHAFFMGEKVISQAHSISSLQSPMLDGQGSRFRSICLHNRSIHYSHCRSLSHSPTTLCFFLKTSFCFMIFDSLRVHGLQRPVNLG